LYLASLMGVSTAGIGSKTLDIVPSEKSIDKFIRLSGFSSFMECSIKSRTLDISEGCDIR
jgi:hypothetical protein